MKTVKICFSLLFALLISSSAFSQDSTRTFTLSGSIDVYARTALATTNAYTGGGPGPSSAFAQLKGFSLGMANLIASYNGEKAGFVADLVFGPRGNDAVFYSDLSTGSYTGQRIINQMYGYLKLGDAVTLNLGQFNTFLGYEVISPTVNFNYSTSYLFSYGPFTHTGLRADFDFGGGFVGKLAIMNPTDMLEFNPVNTYTLGAQIGKTSDAGGVWLNVIYGDQDGKLDTDVDPDGTTSAGSLFQIDLTTGWNLSDAVYLGFNTSYQTVADGKIVNGNSIDDIGGDATSFFGAAVYPKFTLSESFALGLRGEYFSVKKDHLAIFGTDNDGDGDVVAVTLSGNYKVGNLTLIPEVRIDKTSEDSFNKKDGDPTDMMTSLLLAAVYKF
ncbi:outer membrane beta-barrel protein [Chryseolinea sp. H1M3-3]|uniref:outer membrane beta-barrel protein n=1 Tax=Chryseolinea sp. H1M3-3 TaxID=3034144 RepID=UPI0023EB5B9A|nr:outer membrane beta-barrel protein [Chryseolinea sp. H1M3-3]